MHMYAYVSNYPVAKDENAACSKPAKSVQPSQVQTKHGKYIIGGNTTPRFWNKALLYIYI